MSTESLTCQEMIEPLERFMERRAGSNPTAFSTEFPTADDPPQAAPEGVDEGQSFGHLDLVHLVGDRQSLHLLRVVERFDTCLFDMERGLLSLSDVPANYAWIALPLDEFRLGEQEYGDIFADTCAERGIGIAVVQPRGKGLSGKSMVEPTARAGSFIRHHADLAAKWRQTTRGYLVGDDYRVVEYYPR